MTYLCRVLPMVFVFLGAPGVGATEIGSVTSFNSDSTTHKLELQMTAKTPGNADPIDIGGYNVTGNPSLIVAQKTTRTPAIALIPTQAPCFT